MQEWKTERKGGRKWATEQEKGGGIKVSQQERIQEDRGGKTKTRKNSHTIAEGKVFNQPIQTIKARCNCLGGGRQQSGRNVVIKDPRTVVDSPKVGIVSCCFESQWANYAVLSDTFPTSSPGNDKSPSVWRLAFGFVVELSWAESADKANWQPPVEYHRVRGNVGHTFRQGWQVWSVHLKGALYLSSLLQLEGFVMLLLKF